MEIFGLTLADVLGVSLISLKDDPSEYTLVWDGKKIDMVYSLYKVLLKQYNKKYLDFDLHCESFNALQQIASDRNIDNRGISPKGEDYLIRKGFEFDGKFTSTLYDDMRYDYNVEYCYANVDGSDYIILRHNIRKSYMFELPREIFMLGEYFNDKEIARKVLDDEEAVYDKDTGEIIVDYEDEYNKIKAYGSKFGINVSFGNGDNTFNFNGNSDFRGANFGNITNRNNRF